MLTRIIFGLLILAVGYYVGRQVGRTEPIRKQLAEMREKGHMEQIHAEEK